MATAVSDGNGGLYIRRTIVEKMLIGTAGLFGTTFCSIMVLIGQATYRELRSQREDLIHLSAQLKAVAEQSAANEAAINEHDKWSREERERIYKRIEDLHTGYVLQRQRR